ncbi:class I SAM-dependent methyltransferase [Undibacterium sp. LX40W]|uniref:Class I SAM-dependent methyltransferase n=1 Tax=Undibacterium nitidum TaxID=2762298 RepID=A0A923KSB2_9BURK|nr:MULTISPECIES: class I SAM-dependent methyltransferase [Undibacterium]MBC3880289.1 class I SAM-dependent methyltransferase [Undibacterium nitidum]MBC3890975.1 class I SAM-dependent methyltransferase [Undibacterium sp. LX40W]
MKSDKSYLHIVEHYESCLEKFGDSHRGVDWPKLEDAETRYRVMLGLIPAKRPAQEISILDFGCGAAHLLEYMQSNSYDGLIYSGLDLSQHFIELCKQKFPVVDFYCMDILESSTELPMFDYIVLNGVFTEKRNLTFDEMRFYFCRLIQVAFEKARFGIAFNVMSSHVDWERDDLFHLPMDMLADFLVKNISRNFVIRNDYGLYEYTVYIYR